MKKTEADEARGRIRRFEDISREITQLSELRQKVEAISGNASEVSKCTAIVVETRRRPDLRLEGVPITDWELRDMLLPVINEKVAELKQARDDV